MSTWTDLQKQLHRKRGAVETPENTAQQDAATQELAELLGTLGPVLWAAMNKPQGLYLVRMRHGDCITFAKADYFGGEWVELMGAFVSCSQADQQFGQVFVPMPDLAPAEIRKAGFCSSIHVRIPEIAWAAAQQEDKEVKG